MKHLYITIVVLQLAGCARFESRPISSSEVARALESRALDDPNFKDFLEINLARRLGEWPIKSWDFEALSLAAIYYHPSLDLARVQWWLASAGQITAAARPNPVLSVVPGYNFSATDGLNPWIPSVTFDLPLEIGGKRGYRKAMAGHLSEAARLNITTAAWQVRSNLRMALIDFTAARQREILLQRQLSLQERMTQSMEQQLQAGAISSSELTLVRIALNQIQLDLSDARQQRADAFVRVADSIGVTVKALTNVEVAYELSDTHPIAFDLLGPEARAQALTTRADILAGLADYDSKQSALQLEIAKQYPDIHLGPGYQFDQGDHKFSLSVSAELPLLNQNQGPIAEAEVRRAESAARFNALQARVITEIDRASAAYQVAQSNLSILESLAADHRKRSEEVKAQLQAGAASEFDLVNSQIELGASELLQLNGRVKVQQVFGTLEDALQRPLHSMPSSIIEQSQRLTDSKPAKP